MAPAPWQFWIDVGGTFTDCLARRPDGRIVRCKLLSSGVTKGSVGADSSAREIVDPLRKADPPNFWAGYQFRLFDASGAPQLATTVTAFDADAGQLRLRDAVPNGATIGQQYELQTGVAAPIIAVRYLLGLPLTEPIPPIAMRLGTTRGTNALLTRTGAPTALVTTRGFRDVLRIGYQNRPKLFELDIRSPQPLFERVIEIDQRVTPSGEVLVAPDAASIRGSLDALRREHPHILSLAICLLNAYSFGEHERLIERIAREVGFEEISVSSRIAPLIKLVSRGDTTVVDAYLNPVLREYVADLQASLSPGRQGEAPAEPGRARRPRSHGSAGASPSQAVSPSPMSLRIMTSAGGLVDAEKFVGKDSIFSGPAGGVVGFAAAARAAGFTHAIGFDMGGTSTDVSRWDGRFERQYETEKAGVRIVAPMMAIETVAAGGGSICHFDGVKLCVGPHSAGAQPGPACYGAGGPLTVTDVNLALGKILPERFPFALSRSAVEVRLREIIEQVAATTGRTYAPLELADGFLQIANANMAQAIRSVSIAKGCDPREYALVAFGGAAGQHACAIAEELGMRQILIHPDAGILSALGIGMASVERNHVEGIYQRLDEFRAAELEHTFQRLERQTAEEVAAEGIDRQLIATERFLDLRYAGLDAYLTIPKPDDADWAAAYASEHLNLYGYTHAARPVEVVAARVTAIGRSVSGPSPAERIEPTRSPVAEETTTAHFAGSVERTRVYHRAKLRPGDGLSGPAILLEANATTIVDPGWGAEVLSDGQLLLNWECEAPAEPYVGSAGTSSFQSFGSARGSPSLVPASPSATADPVLLEIFNNHFAAIAEQMGITLRNTSSSVNVKERLDFSCAIFTSAGELVVNAPHIPVHLGAMSLTVRSILQDNPNMQPGDVFVTNDPYRGGSHLPDITVVTPVHGEGGELLFFTASRAHHAEIGGVRPGSMPPLSKNLAEEGVLIRNFKIVASGQSRMEEFRELLLAGPYPTRNVADNLADVGAQIAANHQGARDLLALIQRHTLHVVQAYMQHIQTAAETKMRAALAKLPDGQHTFIDRLDDGSPIAVAIDIAGDAATIDFAGTGPVLPGNLNANRAIVTAAVMYVLRCLIDEDIPLNEGVLAPVEIIVPECLLNPPSCERAEDCSAVAGGNVETSQRVVDVLLGALGVAAASQGTMNNLLFGDAAFGYYETIGGGAGATAAAPGADAVHTHMTNTRLTDPEVLEQRYPVRVHEFAIRRGSGGPGRYRGGDGIIRRIEFLKQLDVSILAQRRGAYRPYGLAGGAAGEPGRNTLTRADGTVEQLAGIVQFTAQAGDVLTIETPGGGGFGT